MTTMVYSCFFFCCLFAPWAMLCVNVTDEVQGLCPFCNQTVEGYQPEIDRNRIIFHFRPLFQARCSPLTKSFFAQVCSRYICLSLEFSCPAVMFAFPFTRPATTFFCCWSTTRLTFYWKFCFLFVANTSTIIATRPATRPTTRSSSTSSTTTTKAKTLEHCLC